MYVIFCLFMFLQSQILMAIILSSFFFSSAPRVPIEESVTRKTMGMREEARATGNERVKSNSLLCFLLTNVLHLHACHVYMSVCKVFQFTFPSSVMFCHALSMLRVSHMCFCNIKQCQYIHKHQKI